MRVKKVSPEEWKVLSEPFHSCVFDKHKPSEWDRIDYALMCVDSEKNLPMGYVTCQELDSKTIYWQYGGILRDFRSRGVGKEFTEAVIDWCFDYRYDRIGFRVENTNTHMLKIAMEFGFQIIGIRNFKGSILLEHVMEREPNAGQE